MLARDFAVSLPAISQHLGVWTAARLVVHRAEGTRRIYALNPACVDALRNYFDRFWAQAVAAFKKAAEEDSCDDRS